MHHPNNCVIFDQSIIVSKFQVCTKAYELSRIAAILVCIDKIGNCETSISPYITIYLLFVKNYCPNTNRFILPSISCHGLNVFLIIQC